MSTEPITPPQERIGIILDGLSRGNRNGAELSRAEMDIREAIALEIEDAIIRATVVDTSTPEIGMFSSTVEEVTPVQAYLGAANIVRGLVPLTEEQFGAQLEETTRRRNLLVLSLASRAESEAVSGPLEPVPAPVVMTPELMAAAADGAVMYDFEGDELTKYGQLWAYTGDTEYGIETPVLNAPYTSVRLDSYPEKEA